jgi:hypothetical protein
MDNLSAKTLPWSSYQKIGFRFAFLFLILFIILLDWSVNPVLSYFYYEAGLAYWMDRKESVQDSVHDHFSVRRTAQ